MSREKKTLLKNIFSVGIIQVANYIFPLITIPIVSRIIGPDKLGTINFAASFIAYFTLVIGFGFDVTATRRVAADPSNEQNRSKVFSEVFLSQCLLLFFSILVFVICLFFIPQLRIEKEVAIYTFITCFATLLTQNWLFQAMQDLHKIAVLSLIGKVIFTVIVLATINVKSDYYWQPLALSLSQVLIAVVSFFWSINKYHLKLLKVSFRNRVKVLRNEKTFFFSLCVISVYTTTTVVVLGITNDAVDVGYYTAGQKLILIMQMIITVPLTQAIFPYIGKAFGDSFDKGITIVQKIIPIVFLFTLVCGILIFFLAPYFISFFYGSYFTPAVLVCRILAFIPMVISLSVVLGIHVMINLKMDKVFFNVTVTGALLGMTLNLIIVSNYGYIGAAITWITTESIVFFLLLFMLQKRGVHVIKGKYFNLKHFWIYFIKMKTKFINKAL
jgi:O-antigen/teichoic acid export membrane protein